MKIVAQTQSSLILQDRPLLIWAASALSGVVIPAYILASGHVDLLVGIIFSVPIGAALFVLRGQSTRVTFDRTQGTVTVVKKRPWGAARPSIVQLGEVVRVELDEHVHHGRVETRTYSVVLHSTLGERILLTSGDHVWGGRLRPIVERMRDFLRNAPSTTGRSG